MAIDKATLSKLASLQSAFYGRKGEGAGGVDYEKQAAAVGEILSDLRKEKFLTAQKKMEELQRAFRAAAYRLEQDIKDAGLFSEKKAKLSREAEAVKNYSAQLDSMSFGVERAAQVQVETKAADDTDTLVAAAERVSRNATYDNRFSSPREIGEYLVLAAKNQLRQEKLIAEMAAKIEALEKRLAQFEDPQNLDKPKLTPRPPTA